MASLWFVVLSTGNYWIYPTSVAKGWDATLAHLPYYDLRHQAMKFIEDHKIPVESVGSFFPNTATIDAIDLNGDQRSFPNFASQPYVFYSSVYNLDDAQYEKLDQNYEQIKRFGHGKVFVAIYKQKDLD